MRIALFPDDYLPDCTLVHAKMFQELALEFKRLGHYPIIITPGESTQRNRLQVDFIEGVEVWRFRNGKTRGQGKIRRGINESIISINAYLAIRNKVKDSPFDYCVNYAPTIFFGPLVKWLKFKYKTYNYLVLRDIFPLWAVDTKLITKYSIFYYYFSFFENLNYKSSDCIGLMSKANLDFFKIYRKNIKNTEVLPNWASLKPTNTSVFELNIRDVFNLHNKIIYFYGGNIGHAQDMTNLLRLVNSMKSEKNAFFLFVGQGDEFDLVGEKIIEWDLSNLLLLPSVSQKIYKEILQQIDVGLFSLDFNHKMHNFPGKLLGYMVQSLPVLGSVNPNNDLVDYINMYGAGNVFINGEDDLLLNAAKKMLVDDYRIECGKSAYKMLENEFSVESIANQLLSHKGN